MLGCGVNGVATLDCIFPLLTNIIYWLVLFSGTISLIVIIVSGLRFVTSGGEAKSVETAKKTLSFAVLGLLLVFLAFLILNTVAYITGVACLSDITKGVPTFQSCQGHGGGGSWGSTGGCSTGSCASACSSTEVTVAGSCTIGGAPGVCCTPRVGGP